METLNDSRLVWFNYISEIYDLIRFYDVYLKTIFGLSSTATHLRPGYTQTDRLFRKVVKISEVVFISFNLFLHL